VPGDHRKPPPRRPQTKRPAAAPKPPTREAATPQSSARSNRRAAQVRRRRQTRLAGLAVAAVVAVVAIVVGVGLGSGGAKAAPRTPVPADVSHTLQSVQPDVLAAAASKVTDLQPVQALTGAPLTSGNKPEILYIGAEFCPICATERWPLLVALSQFGSFTNLQQTRSAIRDGNIATLSFYTSTYSSPYLTFTPVETTTNQPNGDSYQPLETPTPAQQALWSNVLKGNLSFPFIDIAGKFVLNTSQFPETTLAGLTFDAIATTVGNNSTDVGASIDASAASLVKVICGITRNQPATACQAIAGVNAAISPSTSGPG
jgi:hypothetical protein